ncbi:hypothetical protein [Nonomuraea sp. LPB2021202275-12-8]|uniref:hypothetical protein n=1 Tax=Nonomuraea sp. LPB2021202275-12-8 TaxID=3120159 RepID=UPI00300D94BF
MAFVLLDAAPETLHPARGCANRALAEVCVRSERCNGAALDDAALAAFLDEIGKIL